ncbi:hypothetical protein CAF53_04435 [Sphingobium sp. LB126]|uniref:hypothetical protein n=1 Tax=Sphingobium sp. LB126 TaxID=1983755 RepID=UPI000CBE0450|nr:hypothetical protein [Sphingobium sp. LB126]PJG47570.1 hypothetical protein CAF53_04435 [Sphingobium sp. LB126]
MKRRNRACALFPAMLLFHSLSGCAKSDDKAAVDNAVSAAPGVEAIDEPDAVTVGTNEVTGLPTDDWIGRWNGPEGLFLDIQLSPDGKPGHYAITNKDNLDRQGDYGGVAEGTDIRFVRDGRDLTIRPGIGSETGFKYLAGRKDCLIVVPGREGYCR